MLCVIGQSQSTTRQRFLVCLRDSRPSTDIWTLFWTHGDAMYTVSEKNCANFFLSELRQMSTNFDNFWQKGGKEAKIM